MLIYAVLMRRNVFGRAKLIYGKCHSVEKSARIIFVGSYALLIGNAIFGCAYEVLRGTHDSDNRENSYTYKEISVAVLVGKASAKSCCNALGDISAAATRAARRTAHLFIHAGCKHDGIYHLYYRLGNVLCSATRLGKVTEAIRAGRASEYANGALSSIKDNLFLNHCNALEFLASSLAYARLKYKLYEKESDNKQG